MYKRQGCYLKAKYPLHNGIQGLAGVQVRPPEVAETPSKQLSEKKCLSKAFNACRIYVLKIKIQFFLVNIFQYIFALKRQKNLLPEKLSEKRMPYVLNVYSIYIEKLKLTCFISMFVYLLLSICFLFVFFHCPPPPVHRKVKV